MIILATVVFIVICLVGFGLAGKEIKDYDKNGRPLDTGLFKKNKK
jgi:hypothetical protein